MLILKNILSESKEHYIDAKGKIERKLSDLPKGSIKERQIAGRKYYYLQSREGQKVVHRYLGKEKPVDFLRQIKERRALQNELKKVSEALRIIKRSEGRKHDPAH
jgi:hypothetical protein